jgi:anti-sigma factor RsiW
MSHLGAETLNLYLDDELDPTARTAADVHLAACAPCREELTALRALYGALGALPPERLPADLTAPVLARLAPARRGRDTIPVALLGAQVVLTGLLAAWLAPAIAGRNLLRLPGLPGPATLGPVTALPDWLAARAAEVGAPIGNLMFATPDLFAGIAPARWALVIALTGVAWLVGNRALLARPARQQAAVRRDR